MDMVLQTVNERIAEHEKKMGRQIMELEHKFDQKFITLNEVLIDIKRSIGAQPRLSKAEDELREVKQELQEMRSLLKTNRQSTSKEAYVQQQVNRGNLPQTPRRNASTAMFGETTARAPSAEHVVQNKQNDQLTPPREPIFDDDYILTKEDLEVALFIRMSHEPAEVAVIGDNVVLARHLKRNVNKGFFYDEVINAYAHISNVETATTSYLTTIETSKLLGDFAFGCENPWVERIARKFVGRRMVHVVLNVQDIHWLLLVFNFDKEEIQVLNSSQGYRDEAKEAALKESIQRCIDEAVDAGLVTTSKPIDIWMWPTRCYTNIPQQEDGHSCGAFTLKYMLSWDGDKMTEDFTQALIDIFSFKVCSRLVRSDCNLIRRASYTKPITEEEYEASLPKESEGPEDEVVEIRESDVPVKPKKRARGRPRKSEAPTNTAQEQLSTHTTTGVEEGQQKKRIRTKSQAKQDPYRSP